MRFILRRLPTFDQILPVFAVIAIFTYGRGLYTFAFKFPAWILFQTLGELLSNLAYGLAFHLLESLGILLSLLLISFILPGHWFKDCFVPRGSWLAAFILGSVLFFYRRLAASGPDFVAFLPNWGLVTLLLSVPVTFLGGRISFLRTAATVVADRLIVLLYLFVPLSLFGLVVVTARNLF